jgi:hypothetical protein
MTFQLAIWWLSTLIPFIISARLVVDVDAFPFLEIQFQQIPLVYDEELLFKLRENFMVVEFFEKGQPKDFLIGISKLPLHQFYLAYRNPVVVKYLSERKVSYFLVSLQRVRLCFGSFL